MVGVDVRPYHHVRPSVHVGADKSESSPNPLLFVDGIPNTPNKDTKIVRIIIQTNGFLPLFKETLPRDGTLSVRKVGADK